MDRTEGRRRTAEYFAALTAYLAGAETFTVEGKEFRIGERGIFVWNLTGARDARYKMTPCINASVAGLEKNTPVFAIVSGRQGRTTVSFALRSGKIVPVS
jgi:hypothetical protein